MPPCQCYHMEKGPSAAGYALRQRRDFNQEGDSGMRAKRLSARSTNKPFFTNQALIRLLVPLVIEQLLAVTIGMADTVMVTSVGEAAVSGISLVDSINILFIQVFSALAAGGAIVTAQYLGRQEQQNACIAAKQLLYATTALSAVIMAAALLFHRFLLRLIFGNIDPAVMENAIVYFQLSAVSYPFLAVYNAGAALFRSMGNSKVSTLVSFLMNVVNIGGNALLIYGFHWGVAGAATASLVSRAMAAAIMLVLICHKSNPVHIEKVWKPELHFEMIRRILKIGVPNGVENGMFQIGKLIVQGLVATFGTSAIAANAIANTIASFINTPGTAIQLGLTTVVGQCVGGRDYEQAVRYTRKLLWLTYGLMALLNLIVFFVAAPLVGLFHLSAAAAADARAVLYTFTLASIVIWPLSFTLPNALRAAGDARFTMIVSMLSMWVFRIGFSYLLGGTAQMGLMGVWIAMYIDWLVRAVVFTFRFARGKWKAIHVI